MTKYWIQKALKAHKRGALHKQLGVSMNKTIPVKTLRDIKSTKIGKHSHGKKVTLLLKRRAVLALNLRKARRR